MADNSCIKCCLPPWSFKLSPQATGFGGAYNEMRIDLTSNQLFQQPDPAPPSLIWGRLDSIPGGVHGVVANPDGETVWFREHVAGAGAAHFKVEKRDYSGNLIFISEDIDFLDPNDPTLFRDYLTGATFSDGEGGLIVLAGAASLNFDNNYVILRLDSDANVVWRITGEDDTEIDAITKPNTFGDGAFHVVLDDRVFSDDPYRLQKRSIATGAVVWETLVLFELEEQVSGLWRIVAAPKTQPLVSGTGTEAQRSLWVILVNIVSNPAPFQNDEVFRLVGYDDADGTQLSADPVEIHRRADTDNRRTSEFLADEDGNLIIAYSQPGEFTGTGDQTIPQSGLFSYNQRGETNWLLNHDQFGHEFIESDHDNGDGAMIDRLADGNIVIAFAPKAATPQWLYMAKVSLDGKILLPSRRPLVEDVPLADNYFTLREISTSPTNKEIVFLTHDGADMPLEL